MRLLRGAAAIAVARKLWTESQKPENQRRMREAVDKVRSRSSAQHRPPR